MYIYIQCVYICICIHIYIVIYGGCIFFVYMSIGWLFLLEHLSPKRCRQVRHLHCDDHQARCTLVPWGWLLKIDRFPWKPGNHGVNIPLHRVLHAIYCNIINIYIIIYIYAQCAIRIVLVHVIYIYVYCNTHRYCKHSGCNSSTPAPIYRSNMLDTHFFWRMNQHLCPYYCHFPQGNPGIKKLLENWIKSHFLDWSKSVLLAWTKHVITANVCNFKPN